MQPDRALNDAGLDLALKRAFAVDPSPQFTARVRARIADESPREWTWGRSWSFAGGVVAAIVITMIAMQLSNRRGVPAAAEPLLAARAVVPVAGVLIDRVADVVARQSAEAVVLPLTRPRELSAERGARAGQAIAVANDRAAAEVLLDPRETAALQALVARVRAGRLDLGPAVRATVPSAMDLPPIDDIVISPISIEPLAPAGAEGARQ